LSDLETNFDESYEPSSGLFGEYFDANGEVTVEILPFLDITEEEQSTFMTSLKQQEEAIRKNKEKNRNVISVATIFKNLPHRNRSFLKRHRNSSLLYKTDSQLFDFLNSDLEMIEILNSDPYERLMIHSICKFYNLNSHSKNKNGKKLVLIKKKLKQDINENGLYYMESLSSFLESLYQKESEDDEDFSSDEEQDSDGLYNI